MYCNGSDRYFNSIRLYFFPSANYLFITSKIFDCAVVLPEKYTEIQLLYYFHLLTAESLNVSYGIYGFETTGRIKEISQKKLAVSAYSRH